jgi:uncharacterized membrane protein YfcA
MIEHTAVWLPLGVALIALVYSLVGHGGASGYLALLAMTTLLPRDIAITALLINLVVAGTSFTLYKLAHHFSWRLAWPLLAGSVPLAFVGARLPMADTVYYWLVGGVLLVAGVRLFWATPSAVATEPSPLPGVAVRVGTGAGIGLLSGLVGVGGGIFLSPVLLLMRWATAKQTAAVSAIFIVANSLAGLAGRLQSGGQIQAGTFILVAAGFVGALAGSYMGAFAIGQRALQRGLAIVLVFAAVKLMVR